MFQELIDTIIICAIAYAVTFVGVFILINLCSKSIMRFLGVDYFCFDLKKRLKLLNVISLVMAALTAMVSIFG